MSSLPPFSLSQLQVFLTVMERGSASAAAEDLGVTQPAVSQQVRELERIADVALFRRHARGLEPTAAARALRPAAARTLTAAHDAWTMVGEFRHLERGTLRVAASLTIATYTLPAVLGRFARLYPTVQLAVRMANTRDVAVWTLGNEVDLGVVEGEPPDDLDIHPYDKDALILIGPPDATLSAVGANDLPTLPLILREPGSGTRALVDDRLGRLGLVISPWLELGSLEAIKRLVEAGIGYSIVSRRAVDRELDEGRVREIPVQGLELAREFAWISRRGDPLSPAARAFIALLAS